MLCREEGGRDGGGRKGGGGKEAHKSPSTTSLALGAAEIGAVNITQLAHLLCVVLSSSESRNQIKSL